MYALNRFVNYCHLDTLFTLIYDWFSLNLDLPSRGRRYSIVSFFQIEDPSHRKGGGTFLVPMNGGIWTMCVSLEGRSSNILQIRDIISCL